MGERIDFPYEGRILVCMNLPYNAVPTDLRDLFITKGKVLRVDIEKTKRGETNGMAFVEFNSAADCQSACELNGQQFMGRTLKCRIADRPPPELIRFYIKNINDRPVNESIKQRIIQEAITGVSIERRPAPRKCSTFAMRQHRRRKERQEQIDGEKTGNGEAEYSYSYSDYSDDYSD